MEVLLMDILIGGLLMFSLISSPITKIDCIAYELYKTQNQIISVIKKYQENEDKSLTADDIDTILYSIDTNSKNVVQLLKEKNELSNKINTTMDLLAYSRQPLTESQMNGFKEYSEFCLKEEKLLQKNLAAIKDKHIKDLTQKILINDGNYENIYDQLINISNCQYDAMYSLNNIIEKSNQTLQIL